MVTREGGWPLHSLRKETREVLKGIFQSTCTSVVPRGAAPQSPQLVAMTDADLRAALTGNQVFELTCVDIPKRRIATATAANILVLSLLLMPIGFAVCMVMRQVAWPKS